MADETNLPISLAQRIQFKLFRSDFPEGEVFDKTFKAVEGVIQSLDQLKRATVLIDLKHPQGSRATPNDPEDESHVIWQDETTGDLKTKITNGGNTVTRTLVDYSEADIAYKVIAIGNWDMDTLGSANVAHGLTFTKILGVQTAIINDAGTLIETLNGVFGHYIINTTNVQLQRAAGSPFDHVDYNLTPYNRGYILITYLV